MIVAAEAGTDGAAFGERGQRASGFLLEAHLLVTQAGRDGGTVKRLLVKHGNMEKGQRGPSRLAAGVEFSPGAVEPGELPLGEAKLMTVQQEELGRSPGATGGVGGADFDPVIAVGRTAAVEGMTGGFQGVVAALIVVELVVIAPAGRPRNTEPFQLGQDVLQRGLTASAGIVMPQITGRHDEVGLEVADEILPIALGRLVVVGKGQPLLHAAEEVVVGELEQADSRALAQIKPRHSIAGLGRASAAANDRRGGFSFGGHQAPRVQYGAEHEGRGLDEPTARNHRRILESGTTEAIPCLSERRAGEIRCPEVGRGRVPEVPSSRLKNSSWPEKWRQGHYSGLKGRETPARRSTRWVLPRVGNRREVCARERRRSVAQGIAEVSSGLGEVDPKPT